MELLAFLIIGASFAGFRGLHWILKYLPMPKAAARNRWKWQYTCVSLVHSVLAGTGALLGVVFFPQIIADPVHFHSPWFLTLVSISVGYFLADGVELFWNQALRQTWPELCHHVVVAICFTTAILVHYYLGFMVVSLLMMLNSICQNIRKLLLFSRKAPSRAFNMASWATMVSFVIFRLVPLGWMILWLSQHYHEVHPVLVVLGIIGLFTVGVLSIIGAVQILISDVRRSRHCPFTSGHKETPETRFCLIGEQVAGHSSTLRMRN
ncbi:TLC domain-containing protein 2-like [Suncus etruscus]|uniref:TLC domain-containing protein 2-like n=1 Tax=Suncus etruscus TaxID=109475 RepID=UPI00210F435B|nr:TLC domain-containing protein 2-like [Suncus etruscus]